MKPGGVLQAKYLLWLEAHFRPDLDRPRHGNSNECARLCGLVCHWTLVVHLIEGVRGFKTHLELHRFCEEKFRKSETSVFRKLSPRTTLRPLFPTRQAES